QTWIAARMAGSVALLTMLERVAALDAALELAVLTNNGVLMEQAIPRILGPLAARFDGRVLCSGALRLRKPDPAVFRLALERLEWPVQGTLFVDYSFANVKAARSIGLHAETVTGPRSLGRAQALRDALSRTGRTQKPASARPNRSSPSATSA